jgi:hypothetical protein
VAVADQEQTALHLFLVIPPLLSRLLVEVLLALRVGQVAAATGTTLFITLEGLHTVAALAVPVIPLLSRPLKVIAVVTETDEVQEAVAVLEAVVAGLLKIQEAVAAQVPQPLLEVLRQHIQRVALAQLMVPLLLALLLGRIQEAGAAVAVRILIRLPAPLILIIRAEAAVAVLLSYVTTRVMTPQFQLQGRLL